jgi:uncharacterized DUF497 family protein
MDFEQLPTCAGFQWDEGNTDKNWDKHRVSWSECEQVFFNRPCLIAEDLEHPQDEERFYALGKTDAGRRLFVVFSVRVDLIRVISARDMTKKEKEAYFVGRTKENP